jgi:hypothetical protein
MVPDKGDGCAYDEVKRGQARLHRSKDGPLEDADVVVLQAPNCAVFYWYLPADGTLRPLIAMEGPQ